MAFLLYEVDGSVIRHKGDMYRLAGYNIIYNSWLEKKKPLNQGWHVSADQLIKIHTHGDNCYDDLRLIIDFDPSSRRRIGLIEILDLYAFTYGDSEDKVIWTPLMLRMRDVYYDEFDNDLTEQEIIDLKASIDISRLKEEDFVEFLYLKGDDGGWNWGKNGMTNAAFISDNARSYFRNYF